MSGSRELKSATVAEYNRPPDNDTTDRLITDIINHYHHRRRYHDNHLSSVDSRA